MGVGRTEMAVTPHLLHFLKLLTPPRFSAVIVLRMAIKGALKEIFGTKGILAKKPRNSTVFCPEESFYFLLQGKSRPATILRGLLKSYYVFFTRGRNDSDVSAVLMQIRPLSGDRLQGLMNENTFESG